MLSAKKSKKNSTGRKYFSLTGVSMAVFLSIILVSLTAGTTMAQNDKRIAVVMVNFQNDLSQPYTADYARSMVFGTINSYYQENSFGKLSISGDVFGWYTLPYTNSPCNYNQWANKADEMLAADGVSASNYDYVFYVFPKTSCPWTGLGVIGGKRLWNNGRLTLGIVGHEFGHNIGFKHSNIMNCYENGVRVAMSEDCKTLEYSDPYEIMGSGTFSTNYAAHLSAFAKGSIGWLSDSNKVTATSSGVYTIAPLETATAGIQSLRIPKETDVFGNPVSYYYLEFRQPTGFQNYWRFTGSSPGTNGVTIRVAPDYSFAEPALIDTTPETATFEDAPLLAGRTFTDSKKGISITVVSVTPDGATVQITTRAPAVVEPTPIMTPSLRKNPTLTITPSTKLSDGTQRYTVKLTNNDDASLGPSTFTVSPNMPSYLVQTPRWVSVSNVAPGQTVTFRVSVNGTASGTFSETAINSAATTFTATAASSYTK